MHLKIKIWSYQFAVMCHEDWFIPKENCADLDTVLQQPYKIAAVPALFNRSTDFSYQEEYSSVDLSKFDLVLISDIEYRPREWIDKWIQENNIKRWLLLAGGYNLNSAHNTNTTVYRPWWIYHRDLKYNAEQTLSQQRQYYFDALLGSRRANRDFVMHKFQQNNLLDSSIVTYRDAFPGANIDHTSQRVQEYFNNNTLNWPYISSNLKPEWEVSKEIHNAVSQIVPWDIYNQTWYTIACESVSTGSTFFMAEKISKPMFAKRLFIVFGICGFMQELRNLGYKTFDSVIDESYDLIADDIARWDAAFDQVLALTKKDPVEVYQQLQPVLEHNYQHLLNTELRAQQSINCLLKQTIPAEFIAD